MIDTIVLLLPQDSFQILNSDAFVPSSVAKAMADRSARWATNQTVRAVHGMQSRQNPTKNEIKDHGWRLMADVKEVRLKEIQRRFKTIKVCLEKFSPLNELL